MRGMAKGWEALPRNLRSLRRPVQEDLKNTNR